MTNKTCEAGFRRCNHVALKKCCCCDMWLCENHSHSEETLRLMHSEDVVFLAKDNKIIYPSKEDIQNEYFIKPEKEPDT